MMLRAYSIGMSLLGYGVHLDVARTAKLLDQLCPQRGPRVGRPEVGLIRPGQSKAGDTEGLGGARPHRHFGDACPGRQRQLLAQSRKEIGEDQGQPTQLLGPGRP